MLLESERQSRAATVAQLDKLAVVTMSFPTPSRTFTPLTESVARSVGHDANCAAPGSFITGAS